MHTIVPEVTDIPATITEGHCTVFLLPMVELTLEIAAIGVTLFTVACDLTILEEAFSMCAIIEEVLTLSVGHII